MLKRTIYSLAENRRITGWINCRGMDWGFARRFIAGETLEESLAAVWELNGFGLNTTLDFLGESVTKEADTRAASRKYVEILEYIDGSDVQASVSLKPTQLGLNISADLIVENLDGILTRAASLGNFVRIDIEGSETTERTVEAFQRLRARHENVGLALQSYLLRTEQDIRDLNEIGAQVRLCKGAYKEPASVAFQRTSDVDESYKQCAELLLRDGNYPAFATHDHRIIEHIRKYASENGIPNDAYEFQMLYGIRREYQKEIREFGHPIRIYVPFGQQWCPYFVRRIAERPANAWFVMRAMVRG